MRHTLQFISVDDRNGTRQVGLLLNTVTYDNHLIEHHGVGFHLNLIKDRAPTYGNLTIFVTHIANHQSTVGRRINGEFTIKIGNGT